MTVKKYFVPIIFLTLLLGLTFSSCRKETFLTQGGDLSFSVDTLSFDTVFTTIGSATNSFKIYNHSNKRVKINEITLGKGDTSIFRLNVDGVPGKKFHDIEIAANDSIYVFAAVTVNPTNGTLPFLVEDKVLVTLNENHFNVPLEAYGQDAHYIRDSILQSDNWVNDKPYVIIHSALIDSAQTLTIQKGCRIYMHQDSKLYVKGTLRAFGTKQDSIIFQGDRLDRSYFGYRDFPGEWGGIVFGRSSVLNNLNYCVIKNAGNDTRDGITAAAIYISKANEYMIMPMLELNFSTIYNSASYGVLAAGAQLRIANSLIHSCNLQCLGIVAGGEYDFHYCTFANYGGIGINHAQEPTVAAINFVETEPSVFIGNDLSCVFNNCIIHGSLDDEVAFNRIETWTYNMTFNHCLLQRKTAMKSYVTVNDCLMNQDPLFKEYYKYNYHPESNSPVKNKGIPLQSYPRDLDFKLRSSLTPSIGCYEVD